MTASKKLIQAAAGAGGGDFYPYTIDNSARFDVGSSPYLSRTLGTSGNQKTWTVSYWYKPVSVASWYYQFSTGNSTDFTYIAHTASTSTYGFRLLQNVGNLTQVQMQPTRLLRDTSAWYHIVWAIDTTQATTANRVRLYINGVEETSWQVATYPSQNYNFYWGKNSSVHYVGNHLGNYSNGYMAQVALVFGSQLTPSDFAESKNGVWVPKDITGLSYGAEGSLLAFQDSASLGDDTSGNTNDYASSGLTSSDQMIDTPTNNFATLNPLWQINLASTTEAALSDGNLTATTASTPAYNNSVATMPFPPTGKWYCEVKFTGTVNSAIYAGVIAGLGQVPGATYNVNSFYVPGDSSGDCSISLLSGSKRINEVGSAYGAPVASGSIIQLAVDMDNRKIYFGDDGTWMNSGDPVAGTGYASNALADEVFLALTSYSSGDKYEVNFGQTAFAYTPPTGFVALSTANLPEPAIGPNIDANSSGTTSGENFNTVLYTGTGSARSVTGFGFQPDNLAIKTRSISNHWHNVDAVRGVSNALAWSWDGAEFTSAVDSFDSDGFSVYDGQASVNGSGTTYVAYGWKGNGSGVSNTDGSITSTVSANTDAGISIVTYTGNGTAGASVGHGLGVAPKFIVVKDRTQGTTNWNCYVEPLTKDKYIPLNQNSAASTFSNYWADGSGNPPNSSTFFVRAGSNTNTNSFLAYLFAEVEGFSSFGSYTGNGSADGPFIFTGMRPAWVMVKRTNAAENWAIIDDARDPYNLATKFLRPDETSAETTGAANMDLLSNGFKLRNTDPKSNASGSTYIYMAFAEMPFKYSVGR